MTKQQAINILNGLEQSLDDYCELNNEGKAAFRMAIAALEVFGNSEQLPSAQPDVVRCKDCKYYRADGDCWHEWDNDGWIYYQSVIDEPNPDDYCSKAERREE